MTRDVFVHALNRFCLMPCDVINYDDVISVADSQEYFKNVFYRVGQKIAPCLYTLKFHQILTNFKIFFHCQNQEILPHLKCVATLPSEMSDHALKPATPLINVDRAWHVCPQTARTYIR